MLISDNHKIIFIHIYKNAGTSIARALLPYTSRIPFLPVLRNKLKIIYSFPEPYKGHIKAPELICEIGQDKFNSYYSFAFVRNPWDWQVSLYSFMLRDKTHFQHELVKSFNSFEEYIVWRCSKKKEWSSTKRVTCQKDFIYSENGQKLVNFIGKYENLEHDFKKICSAIGVSANLPKLNVSNKKPYQEYYNNKSIQLIRDAFRPDIELFGYDFE